MLDKDSNFFGIFGVENIPKKIRHFIGNKNIHTNIFRTPGNNSIICGYFHNEFFDYILAGKILTHYTSLFSSYDFKENDDIILRYFQNKWST